MIGRIFSTLVLVPLVLLLLLAGSSLHLLLVLAVIASLLLYEWHALFPGLFASSRAWVWPAALGLPTLVAAHLGGGALFAAVALVALFLLMTRELARWTPGQIASTRMAVQALGLFYCVGPLALGVLVRAADGGGKRLLFLLLVIWATDIGAFAFGKTMGKRKLAPAISPGKTWEGTAGGTLSALVVAWFAAPHLALPLSPLPLLVVGLLLSLSGQVGDLVESLFKREAGVKDAGRLIPGHGGFLDRLDSLLFALPVYHLCLLGAGLP